MIIPYLIASVISIDLRHDSSEQIFISNIPRLIQTWVFSLPDLVLRPAKLLTYGYVVTQSSTGSELPL